MTTDTTVSDTSALSREQFEEALRAHADRYWSNHPFHHAMHEGKLTRDQLQAWVVNRYYYQKCLPLKDAAIISNCADREVRRRWAERIIYQDGSAPGQGGIEEWIQLGKAVGLTAEELEGVDRVLPGVRFAVDAYVTFARTRPWIEAVASSLTELFSPGLMTERANVFEEHYHWVETSGLQYFRARPPQAKQDAKYALELVLQRCRTREQQEAAIAALTFKSDVLWSILDAVHYRHSAGDGETSEQ